MARWGSKRSRSGIPTQALATLSAYGRVSFEARAAGHSVSDPRFSWDGFFGPAKSAFDADPIGAIEDLSRAAGDDPYARFGAHSLILEIASDCEHPRCIELTDHALRLMHDAGLSSGHLTRGEADRWIATHGDLRSSFDHIVDMPPPSADRAPALALEPGQRVVVATMGPGAIDNQFWIERTGDGSYGVFSMRPPDSAATTLSRYNEGTIGRSDTIDGVLRRLGAYLRSPTYWAHESLVPYFTERRAF